MSAFKALSYPAFRRFILARFLLIFSIQMQNLLISWKVYEITKNPLSLGLIGIAEIIPFLVTVFFAGYLADKISRKLMVIAAATLITCSSILLGLVTLVFIDDWAQDAIIFMLYGIMVMIGFGRGFFGPAGQAMIPGLVKSQDFPNATTWNTSVFHAATIMGPAFGGLLYGIHEFHTCIPLLLTLQAMSLFFFVSIQYQQTVIAATTDEKIVQKLTEGIRYVFTQKVIVAALLLDLFAVLFGGATAMLPVFAKEIFACGAQGLGLLRAAPAMGAIVMAAMLMLKPPQKNAGVIMLFSVAGFGVCMIAFAFSQNYYLSFIILALSGALDNVSVVIRQTIVQMNTPEHMRGRVAAVNSIFIGLSNELGSFESGVAARAIGLVPSVAIGGMITVLVVTFIAMKFPVLKTLKL